MRRLVESFAACAALVFPGCFEPNPVGSGDGGKSCEPACRSGQVCERATGTCMTALPEGSLCEGVDGGMCEPPLTCGKVTSQTSRCSMECTKKSEPEVCGGRTCYARPGGSGAFCVTPIDETSADQSCDEAKLVFCVGTLRVCIAATAVDTAGRCFKMCSPSAPDCPTGQSCADPWAPADPTRGLCVTPPPDATCDYALFKYCALGETCARGVGAQTGYCHKRCDPTLPSSQWGCATGQQCVGPWKETPTSGICVIPQATGGKCDAALNLYCGVGDLCVFIQSKGSSECAIECTGDPAKCTGTGKSCQPAGDGTRSVCV